MCFPAKFTVSVRCCQFGQCRLLLNCKISYVCYISSVNHTDNYLWGIGATNCLSADISISDFFYSPIYWYQHLPHKSSIYQALTFISDHRECKGYLSPMHFLMHHPSHHLSIIWLTLLPLLWCPNYGHLVQLMIIVLIIVISIKHPKTAKNDKYSIPETRTFCNFAWERVDLYQNNCRLVSRCQFLSCTTNPKG